MNLSFGKGFETGNCSKKTRAGDFGEVDSFLQHALDCAHARSADFHSIAWHCA